MNARLAYEPVETTVPPSGLRALLNIPLDACGLVLFVHGSGSGRHSPRNTVVATKLAEACIATLLTDLLLPDEEGDRAKVFDMTLLARRVLRLCDWAAAEPRLAALPLGLFGASTGAGAALRAAALAPDRIACVVSRGGRPDLAGEQMLAHVRCPKLLIVGSQDWPVIGLNRSALAHLGPEAKMVIVPGATHLFEEPGTLDEVVEHTRDWFLRHFGKGSDIS